MNITCPTCEDEISVEEELFNTKVECPCCGQSILLQSTQTVSMFEAIRNRTVEGVKQAIADGADVNAVEDGMTPLYEAVYIAGIFSEESAPKEIITLLIDNGADVNANEIIGGTPLHQAVEYDHGHREVIELLIAKGADVNARANCTKLTPLDYVLRFLPEPKKTEIITLFRINGGKTGPELVAEGISAFHSAVRRVNAQGKKINDTNSIKMVLVVLFMPLLLIIIPLNWLGGIGSVIWCVINSKWLVLFVSLLGVVFGHMLLGIAILIPLVFAMPLINSDGQGSKIVTGVLMFLLCVTRATVLSAWVFLVFKLFHGLLPDDRVIVCVIVFLQVSGAINYLALKNSNDEDDPSRLLAAISSVGCLFSLVTWYFFPVANYHLFIYPALQLFGECVLVQDMIWQKKHGT